MILTIRAATVDDAEVLADIQVTARNTSYVDFLPPFAMEYNSMDDAVQDWKEWLPQIHGVIGVNEKDEAVGFCCYGPIQTRLPSDKGPIPRFAGEIFALYVHPDHWRHGYGRTLLQAGFDKLTEMKIPSACLWVKSKNLRAQSLYLSMGGEKCGKRKIDLNGYMASETAIGFRSYPASE